MNERRKYTRDMTRDWYLPGAPRHLDWRKDDDYAYVYDLPNRELAWEFLRRNPDYIQQAELWIEQRQREPLDLLAKMPDSFEDDAVKRLQLVKLDLDKKCDALCESFGLLKDFGLRHPDAGAPLFDVEGPFEPVLLKQWVDGAELDMLDVPPRESRLCMDVRITAEEPLEKQLAEIKAHYERMIATFGDCLDDDSSKKNRRQKQLYPDYLRIWDAHISGVSVAEIALQLDPDNVDRKVAQDRVSTRLKAAKGLVNGGYLNIAAHGFRK